MAHAGEVEIEFQPLGALRAGTTKALTDAIFNYGFAERWEVVLQTEMLTPISPSGITSLAAQGAFLKWVVRPGVLQDQPGPSIAMEFMVNPE